jgi:NitT/TauT family transport system substrate-binding protein
VEIWFDALAWIRANTADAVAIMAKKGGVSVEDYQSAGAPSRYRSPQ